MQDISSISIWQGEDFKLKPSFADNLNIGHFVLRDLQLGIQNEIEVTYSMDADGILTVSAQELGGDARVYKPDTRVHDGNVGEYAVLLGAGFKVCVLLRI